MARTSPSCLDSSTTLRAGQNPNGPGRWRDGAMATAGHRYLDQSIPARNTPVDWSDPRAAAFVEHFRQLRATVTAAAALLPEATKSELAWLSTTLEDPAGKYFVAE